MISCNHIGTPLAALGLMEWPHFWLRLLSSQPDQKSAPFSSEDALRQRLEAELKGLSVRAYERLIAHVLRACGYEDVRILRNHSLPRRSHRGRTAHGGVDLTAALRAEFGVTSVAVQAKQYARPVPRRFVDELRGVLLRTGARQGLLFTTSSFTEGTRRAASENPVGPIHLIDGRQLQELLIVHRLGVKRNRRGRLVLRPRYFRRLDQVFSGDAPCNNTSHNDAPS